jgi:hypothetical protein
VTQARLPASQAGGSPRSSGPPGFDGGAPQRSPHCGLLIGKQGAFIVQHEARPVTTHVHNGLLVVGRRPAIRHVQALRITADAIEAALSVLTASDVPVHAALAVDSTSLASPRAVAGVTILSVMDLRNWLCRRDDTLSQEMIVALAAAAQRLFDEAPSQD